MKKISFFDAFIIFSLLSLFFVIGCHLGKNNDRYAACEFILTVIPEKTYGTPNEDMKALIDGKYECTVLEYRADKIVLLCSGYYSDAGYLLSGAKYISLNQPIKASQPWGYFDGKIHAIGTERAVQRFFLQTASFYTQKHYTCSSIFE